MQAPKRCYWLVTFRTANDHPVEFHKALAENAMEAIEEAMKIVKGRASEEMWGMCATIKAEWMA